MNDDDSIQKKETSIIINNNKPDLPEISKKSKSQNPKEKKLSKFSIFLS